MKYLLLIVSLLCTTSAQSDGQPIFSGKQISQANAVFEARKVEATMLVATQGGNLVYVHNDERSKQAFSPASTFKILNTLIALDRGVLESEHSPLLWDGVERGVSAWNNDHTLKTAFQVSCVWCYQKMARAIGLENYQQSLSENKYGNQTTGDQVDLFWLNGVLKISALEQIEFLKKLTRGLLDFSDKHVSTLKSIM